MKNVYNTSKLAFHKEKLEALAKAEVTPPIYVRVKPTNKCDHSCNFCSYNPENDCPVSQLINPKDSIPKSKLLEILSDFEDMGIKAITFSGGGEPLVYPYILEAMQEVLYKGIDLSIITNGQKLNGERAKILSNAKWVRVSAGESDAITFAETRRRPESWFYSLGKNIESFAAMKKSDCELGINFVVHKGNAEKVYSSINYFRNLGVDHVKVTPVYNDDFLNYHKNIRKSVEDQIVRARSDFQNDFFTLYDTYENDFNLTGKSERNYSRCFIMEIIPVIGADSTVYFCHDKTYNRQGVLGSLKNQSFKQLWFSKQTAKKFSEFDPRKNCKHHCTYDSRNISTPEMIAHIEELDKFKPSSTKHKNFI